MPRIPSRPPLDLSGKWVVAELPSMPGDYLGDDLPFVWRRAKTKKGKRPSASVTKKT